MFVKQKILYIAYHFPPIQVSSGVHRTLSFCRYLANHSQDVTVLTATYPAYSTLSHDNHKLIPDNITVLRAYARDTARHFSVRGRYLSAMAIPDRWQSWIFGAVWRGWRHIRRHKTDMIISTYPIASAHIIGYLLHKLTGVSWIADFRDPMLQDNYPSSPGLRRVFGWIERKAVQHCKYVIFTSPGAKALYQARYPQVDDGVWQVLPNGFDETLFNLVKPRPDKAAGTHFTLLHSGTIYPHERDPSAFFAALQQLKQQHPECAAQLKVILRSSGHDALYQPMLEQLQIDDMVQLAPSLNYVEALEEMLSADALLLMQADNCNYQTPAKAYEYIRARKPVLALTDAAGDTAALIKQSGVAELAPMNDAEAIVSALIKLVSNLQTNSYRYLADEEIARYSRDYQAEQLLKLTQNLSL